MDVHDEINGALYKIHRPARGKSAEERARQQMQPEHVRTSFPTMGGDEIIDSITYPSADIRTELEVHKYAPDMTCIECGHPDFLHDPRGELVVTPVHRPVHRTPGVTPGTERYDENDPNSPNRVARRPETGQFFMSVDATDPAYAEAEARWHAATRRYRAIEDLS